MRLAMMLPVPILLVPQADASSQMQLRPGERVRLTVPALGMQRHVVRCVEQNGETLTVHADSILTIPLALVTRLDVSRERSKVPVIVGASVGAVLGAVVGYSVANTENCPGGSYDTCPGEQTAGAILAGAVLGGFAGRLLGLAIPVPRWREVPLKRLRAQPVATLGGRFGFAASVRF